jgi:hypothetical protein
MEAVERSHRHWADVALLIQPPAERTRLHAHLGGENFLTASKVD